ncbi:hypothetical protein LIER_21340 [Lithospermum erythrorhizon]|uniref:Uncharacterized protein n=1 Tax=Lithospermum erythrorhizon TaxID=34254 RepID=A0AAV3QQ01_LITER
MDLLKANEYVDHTLMMEHTLAQFDLFAQQLYILDQSTKAPSYCCNREEAAKAPEFAIIQIKSNPSHREEATKEPGLEIIQIKSNPSKSEEAGKAPGGRKYPDQVKLKENKSKP